MKKSFRHAPDRMISGKRRRKPGRPGAAVHTVEIGGVAYTWAVRHAFDVWGKGLRALSVSVALAPARTRELILDLALPVSAEAPAPSAEAVAAAVADGIRGALAAGWDPESRGRAFRWETGEAG